MRYSTFGQTVFAGLALAGLSFFSSAASAAAPAPEVRQVCASVMGLEPNEVHFDGCVQSLSDSYAAMRSSARLIRGRDACLAKGMQPDTPALAQCILDYNPSTDGTALAAANSPVTQGANAPTPASYYSARPQARYERMRYACGALGFDPTTEAFTSCVANLQATLIALDHPKD